MDMLGIQYTEEKAILCVNTFSSPKKSMIQKFGWSISKSFFRQQILSILYLLLEAEDILLLTSLSNVFSIMLFFGTNKISHTAHTANIQAVQNKLHFHFKWKSWYLKVTKKKNVNFKLSRALAWQSYSSKSFGNSAQLGQGKPGHKKKYLLS